MNNGGLKIQLISNSRKSCSLSLQFSCEVMRFADIQAHRSRSFIPLFENCLDNSANHNPRINHSTFASRITKFVRTCNNSKIKFDRDELEIENYKKKRFSIYQIDQHEIEFANNIVDYYGLFPRPEKYTKDERIDWELSIGPCLIRWIDNSYYSAKKTYIRVVEKCQLR